MNYTVLMVWVQMDPYFFLHKKYGSFGPTTNGLCSPSDRHSPYAMGPYGLTLFSVWKVWVRLDPQCMDCAVQATYTVPISWVQVDLYFLHRPSIFLYKKECVHLDPQHGDCVGCLKNEVVVVCGIVLCKQMTSYTVFKGWTCYSVSALLFLCMKSKIMRGSEGVECLQLKVYHFKLTEISTFDERFMQNWKVPREVVAVMHAIFHFGP